jgi:hypothetical protein
MVCSFAFDWVLDFRKNSVGILYWPCIRQGNLFELPSGTWFSMEIAFMMKMDEKDRLIVRLLREDARMPVSELSKRVGLSGPSTGDRMRRLEANGIISRFTVDLDLEALGYPLQSLIRCCCRFMTGPRPIPPSSSHRRCAAVSRFDRGIKNPARLLAGPGAMLQQSAPYQAA